ncbi:MAG: hypothetical protein OXK20_09885, partial [Deltaproteobacteria bacterium]|nr:hypothetical protein [Deltaproteobacteria bacterium]
PATAAPKTEVTFCVQGVVALLLANFLTGGLVWALGPVIPIAMAVLCLVGTWNVVREKLRKSKAFH